MLELLDNLLVAAYLVPTIIGFILVSPAGEALTASLSERFKILSTERGRVTAGLQIITFLGLPSLLKHFGFPQK